MGPEKRKVYIRLPYLGEASEKVKGCHTSCLSRIRCGSVRIIITYDYNRLGGCFPYKDRQPKRLASGLVYKLTCNSCPKFYIGETARCSFIRFSEHEKRRGAGLTEFGRHLKDNPTHNVKFEDNFEILKYGLNFARTRKLAEALLIQKDSRDINMLNDRQKSVPLHLFNV